MKTGWTGGQYSIYRVLLAIATSRIFLARADEFADWASGGRITLLGAAFAACLALGLGFRERLATLLLLFLLGTVVAIADGAPLVFPGLDVALGIALLGIHLGVLLSTAVPPFGSWDARGRPDPAGDWQLPSWTPHVAWAGLAGIGLVSALAQVAGTTFRPAAVEAGSWAWVALFFEILAFLGLVRPRRRAPIWIALSLWHIAYRSAFGPALSPTHLWLFHVLAFDPAWLPGHRGPSATPSDAANLTPRLFYDGDCGLCHRSIRILLSEEGRSADARALRFAPLQGDTFKAWATSQPRSEIESLPDSIVLICEDGRVLTRSSAAIELASRLGGVWRVLAICGIRIPEPTRDALYDRIAAVRKSLFARPKDSCPILPPALRQRFDS